ncbi:hypothetical protein BC943DRAFT_101663 [Umbelopsis sp. AD052]|nr:hypothetical protein BC943DRAFT_101663 [Umbelopsis sp. AD052]
MTHLLTTCLRNVQISKSRPLRPLQVYSTTNFICLLRVVGESDAFFRVFVFDPYAQLLRFATLEPVTLTVPPPFYDNAANWTPGSLQTISWEAPSLYSSVSIALLDSNNQTISDFGTYDASQGNTGQKEISLQGHPSGLYHLKFTALKADGECEIDSEPIQISSTNNAPSTDDLDDIFNKIDANQNTNNSPTTTPPSNQELDDIFNDLNNHGNDDWHVDEDDIEDNGVPSTGDNSGWHSDDVDFSGWHSNEDDVEDNGVPSTGDVSGWHSNEDDVEDNGVPSTGDNSGWHSDDVDFSGWHSNEDDVEDNGVPSTGDVSGWHSNEDDVEENDFSGWHSNEDDVEDPSGWHSDDANAEDNGTPAFGHSDAITDLVNDIENNDISGWHTNEDDIEDTNGSGEPQTFDELIESLDQPYEQYLDNNNATENQPLTTHKNDADVSGDDVTTDNGDSDLSAQLDDIFSKLAGNQQPTTTDDVHTDLHWNSEDNTYFTDEYNGEPSVDDTNDHSDAGWHEDEADIETPTTDVHGDDDPNYKWVGDGTANDEHNDEVPNTWFIPNSEDHSDEVPSTDAPSKWFTDVHNDEVVPPIVDDVPGVHANEVEAPADESSKWFTDVHNDEVVPPVTGEVPGVHADEVEAPADDNSKWFTDVHNDEVVPPVTGEVPGVHADEVEIPGVHANDDNSKWFTDVHNDEVVPPVVDDVPGVHADEIDFNNWVTDEAEVPGVHANDDNSKWFTDVHNDEVVPPVTGEVPGVHADDAKWFTDVHVDDEVPQAHGNDAERWFSN